MHHQENKLHMLIQFIATQAFLTLISLPILVAWGLPTSLWSPLGNLVFSPVLTLYLFCAVCVFFTEVLCIPNGLLVWALDCVSRLWLWCMSLLPSQATIGFVKPHILILLGIPAIAFTALWYVRRSGHYIRAAAFLAMLCGVSGILKLSERVPHEIYTIEHEDMHITCAYARGCVAVIAQDACLARKPSPESWLVYQMMSEVVARTGVVALDHFILLHPRQRLFNALSILCQHVTIKNVYLPRWEGRLSSNAWRAYARMKKTIQEHGGQVHVLGKHQLIAVSDTLHISLSKTEKNHSYQEVKYPDYVFDKHIYI